MKGKAMWIEMTGDCLPELLAQGWSITQGKKSCLVAPDGMRLAISKSPGPTNLYICHAHDTTLFKVGISKKPRARLCDLQV